MTDTSVIVLGFGDEPELVACLHAIDNDLADGDELILIDNGITNLTTIQSQLPPRTRLHGPSVNRGFAGGCNAGAAIATGDVLVFVNSDAVLRAGSIPPLRSAALESGVAVACGCLRLADSPDLVNSVGNPIHFTGITWSGGYGEPATSYREPRPVPGATGGLFAVSTHRWRELGGFNEVYFAYHEDTDLSLRSHLRGLRVMFVPQAVADHHYDFSRTSTKMYLLERNRLILVLTVYPGRVLASVLPALLLIEPALMMLAVRQGWGRQKLSSWWWLMRHPRLLVRMRREVQATSQINDAAFAALLTDRIGAPMLGPVAGLGLLNSGLSRYWRIAKRLIARRTRTSDSQP